jgi:putative zinc finger protein
MRCEDCLPLIEEYFDGEVTGQTATAVSAHLSTCATCAAALDALSFEQEIYARYDRGGLEVTPDLWARVSAEIARTPPPEAPTERRPFLNRARGYFAAALGTLALRPALASSLALLLVAAALGTLWLSRRQQPGVQTQDVARQNIPVPTVAVIPPAHDNGDTNDIPQRENPFSPGESGTVPVAYEARGHTRDAETPQAVRPSGSDISVDELLAGTSAPKASPIVQFGPDEHTPTDNTDALLVETAAPRREVARTEAPLLDPEQKDVARHIERAQMLLRSIKNVRASDAGDIAYEKNLSRKLLAENATLQLEAEVKGDKETKQVLDRIEPFLLEIANMGEKPSTEEVRSIRERVRQNEIVAALEVY